jgi:hypothetical protein
MNLNLMGSFVMAVIARLATVEQRASTAVGLMLQRTDISCDT